MSEQPWLCSTPLDEHTGVDRLDLGRLLSRVEPRDLEQILGQPTQTIDIGDEHSGQSLEPRRQVSRLHRQLSCLADQGSQRRSQVVGDVGGEAPLARLRLGKRADLGLQAPRPCR